jgi:predicted GNAT family acetyltransferase
MSTALASAEPGILASQSLSFNNIPVNTLNIEALTDRDETEVLAFLSLRPIHTVFMASLIRDYGLVSSFNRGTFYGYRNESGAIEGVALIGSKTIIEAPDDAAFEALTALALDNPNPYLIRGEHQQIERILNYARRTGHTPRLVCDELLLDMDAPLEGIEGVYGLRTATPADIEQVVSINADMAFEESGVDPLKTDPQGVTQRALRRVEQGRVWVLVENGQIIFKADVISETPDVIFLEGVYVHPEARGRGYGFRCLNQLGRNLLSRVSSLCLVVNQTNKRAQALYNKSGYKLHSRYCTVYFQP